MLDNWPPSASEVHWHLLIRLTFNGELLLNLFKVIGRFGVYGTSRTTECHLFVRLWLSRSVRVCTNAEPEVNVKHGKEIKTRGLEIFSFARKVLGWFGQARFPSV